MRARRAKLRPAQTRVCGAKRSPKHGSLTGFCPFWDRFALTQGQRFAKIQRAVLAGLCGGIGRRAGLKIQFLRKCRFDPDRRHTKKEPNRIFCSVLFLSSPWHPWPRQIWLGFADAIIGRQRIRPARTTAAVTGFVATLLQKRSKALIA